MTTPPLRPLPAGEGLRICDADGCTRPAVGWRSEAHDGAPEYLCAICAGPRTAIAMLYDIVRQEDPRHECDHLNCVDRVDDGEGPLCMFCDDAGPVCPNCGWYCVACNFPVDPDLDTRCFECDAPLRAKIATPRRVTTAGYIGSTMLGPRVPGAVGHRPTRRRSAEYT